MFLVNVHIKGRANDVTLFFDESETANNIYNTLDKGKTNAENTEVGDDYGHKLIVSGSDIASIILTDCALESRVNVEMTLLGEYSKLDVEKALQSDSKLRFKQNMRVN